MRRQRWWLPLVALVIAANWKFTLTLPVPDEELDTSPKLLGSSVVTSVSIVTGATDNVADDIVTKTSTADRKRVIPSTDLPASPADLMRPDKFQFFTLNKDGNVVTKQMTEKEIQSLIAAGGGHLPMEIHEPQKVGDMPTGGMKVADVVQNVQNVLKGELNKPATVMTSVPTIPGHANTEWSSILPAILGGDTETGSLSEPGLPMPSDTNEGPIKLDATTVEIPDSAVIQPITPTLPTKNPESSLLVDYDSAKKPTEFVETPVANEKPMIQIPVITVDQKLPQTDSMPVFQMLNTISADKINAQNNTHADEKLAPVETAQEHAPGKAEVVAKPEETTVESTPTREPIVEETAVVNDNVPQMIEINYTPGNVEPSVISHTVKPNVKPESESPASMTVISETHSTSMKITGHDEIPMREPSVPIIEPADDVQGPTDSNKPEFDTEKSSIASTIEPKLNPTTSTAEIITEQPIEASTEQNLFSEQVALVENVPQTVSPIIPELIAEEPISSTPAIEEADASVPPKTSEKVEVFGSTDRTEKPEATTFSVAHTTIGGATTSEKPTNDEEPAYQALPEIVPDKKTQIHATLPSEASSIEHIIETLNDPTGSVPGNIAVDHFAILKTPESESNVSKADVIEADTPKSTKVPEIHTATSATPINIETSVESNSEKPLPIELVDSLSSMISQISDARPSVLPLGQSAGLDTAEKTNVLNVNAEEITAVENITMPETQDTTTAPKDSVREDRLPIQTEPEMPVIVSTTVADIDHDTVIATTADTIITTERLRESISTEGSSAIELTTQSSNVDESTTLRSVAPIVSSDSLDKPTNRIDQAVNQKLETPAPEPEKVDPEIDEVQASSEIITDKVISHSVSQESATVDETATQSTVAGTTPLEKNDTNISSTIETSFTNSTASTSLTEHTEPPTILSTNGPTIVQHRLQLEDSKTEDPIKVQFNENNTELPIVRLDILETVPTEVHGANDSEPVESGDDGAESPMVRIKLTDPVAQINSMIESSNVDVRPSPLVSLTLPETGNVPSNIIASSLIAGFPTSTNLPTTTANLNSVASPASVAPVKTPLEVLILSDAAATNMTEDLKTTDGPKNELQVESISKLVTPGLEKVEDVPEKLGTAETSASVTSTTASEVPVERINIPTESAFVESSDEPPIVHLHPSSEAMKDHLKTENPIAEINTRDSIDPKASTTEVTTAAASESQYTPNNLTGNATSIFEESPTTISVSSIGELLQEEIKSSVPAASDLEGLGDKPLELPKIDKVSTASLKPGIITEQPDATEINTSKPAVIVDATASEKVPGDASFETPTTGANEVGTTPVPRKPENDEEIRILSTTQDSQLATTTNSPVAASENVSELSSTVSSLANVASTDTKTETGPSEHNTKLENNPQETEKTKPAITSTSSQQNPEYSANPSMPQQTEEVRIQVNDTAVLVTKLPISDVSSQKYSDPTKPTENQPFEDKPTTSLISSVTEKTYAKLDETILLPVPIKLSNLSSNADTGLETAIKKGVNATETGTVYHGDEQTENIKGDEVPVKANDTRKAIKKNTDSNSLPIEDKVVTPDLNTPSDIGDNPLTIQEKNSDPKLPTKVQITMSVGSTEPSNLTSNSDSARVQAKPIQLPENYTSSNVASEEPISVPGNPALKPILNIKKDDTPVKPTESKWTLIPQTAFPAPTKKTSETLGRRTTTTEIPSTVVAQESEKVAFTVRPAVSLDHPQSANGLDSTVKNLEPDVSYFVNLCNELAFSFWTATNKGLSTARSLAVSPFGMTSMLAMVFLGARGPTSDQMNDVLKLDDVASFNPHLVFQNVTDTVSLARNQGIANAAFVRELFADRSKVRKLMPFYKEKAQKFYDGVVAEVNFATISDLVRRRTNLMIRKQTGGRIKDFVRTNTVPLRSPLAALSANVFQTNCNSSAASSEGRDGELYFAVSPAVRQRKLVPVPATVWRAGFLAGYEPNLDATAMALGGIDNLVSTIFVIPGQQSLTAPGDTLERLEQRLVEGAIRDSSWNKLLKVLIPRPGSELQVPKFSHRSVINATAALKRMGLEELFSKHANLKGINGVATDLHLADVLQMNLFSTCGDENIISGRHHVEVYPASPLRNAREYDAPEEESDDALADYPSSTEEDFKDSTIPYPLQRKARSARQNDATEKLRLKLDRPFLYFVRHNPTGLILHMGRFNPRLLP